MANNQPNLSLKIFTAVAYLLMVGVNALAVFLPINGVTPGEVSDIYANLFAPAGITFSIWGLIYLLLAAYTIYQFFPSPMQKNAWKETLLKKINIYFILSSLVNAAWIFAWHYQIIPLSMLLMVLILICLIMIVKVITQQKRALSLKEKILIGLPFSVYFGWITVATIANATVLLVSLGWNGFGIPQSVWAVFIIVVGLFIGMITMFKNRDAAYGFVIIWAYLGILIKHTSAGGFSGQYPVIIATVCACIVLLFLGEAYLLIFKRTRGGYLY